MDPAASLAPPALLYENFLLYETRARYYLVAYTSDKAAWRVLKISRMEPHELEVRWSGRAAGSARRRAQRCACLGAAAARRLQATRCT